jgi:hypothetical protein
MDASFWDLKRDAKSGEEEEEKIIPFHLPFMPATPPF